MSMRFVVGCAIWLVGCALGDVYTCSTSSQCGTGARCEASGYCSFSDGMCPSGFRYGRWAPSSLAQKCVGASAGGCGDLLLCDSFDGSISSAWLQVADPGTGTLTVESDPAHVYRGSGSLKVHLDPGAFNDVGIVKHDPPIPQNQIYVRMFVYLPPGFAGQFVNAPRILDFSQYGVGYGDVAVDVEDTTSLTLGSHPPVTGGGEMTSTAQLGTARWQCLELQVNAATDGSSTGSATLLVGGASVATMSPLKVDPTQPLNELGIGVGGQLASASGFDLWIDEVAVDNKPIGCQK
jgi:hypothetical protein